MIEPKQEWKDALIDEVVPEVRTGNFATNVVVPRLRDALIEDAEENESGSYAKEVVSDLLYDACRVWVDRIKRSISTKKIAYQMPDGSVARYDNMGVRGYSERLETGELMRQQKLWREMNAEEFTLMYRGVLALATAHSIIAAAFRKVADAFEKFPHAQSVDEVCALAQINPEEIEVQVNDVRRLLG